MPCVQLPRVPPRCGRDREESPCHSIYSPALSYPMTCVLVMVCCFVTFAFVNGSVDRWR